MKANIEGDELIYRAAFSVEKQCYKITTNKETVDLGNKFTITEIKQHLKKKDKEYDVDYTVEGYKTLVPDEETSLVFATSLLDSWIKNIYNYNVDSLNIWLSPSDKSNFRYSIAKTPRIVNGAPLFGYKAGRPTKPIHYQALRDYLKEQYCATEIHGYEADDALGIHKGLMCHIDKDINMVPGLHYNWVKEEVYTVYGGVGSMKLEDNKLKAHGKYLFYAQLLMGDSTDNIPGLKNPYVAKNCNFGSMAVYNYLKTCYNESALCEKVVQAYKTVCKNEWHDQLMEIADLVWIVQEEGITGSKYLNDIITQIA